jgi:hypothetical protein
MLKAGKNSYLDERGQALVEAALVIPILVIILAGVFDLGRYFVLEADVRSACDTACRSIEAARQVDMAALNEEVDALYPSLAGALEISVGDARLEEKTTAADGVPYYHIYDVPGSEPLTRPQTLSQEKRAVTVSLDGDWVTPGLMALSAVTTGGGFHIEDSGTATIDRTITAW